MQYRFALYLDSDILVPPLILSLHKNSLAIAVAKRYLTDKEKCTIVRTIIAMTKIFMTSENVLRQYLVDHKYYIFLFRG